MSQTIDVVVGPNGSIRVETRGFSGSDCRAASQFLEAALGQRATEELTAEYHQAATASQAVRQQQSSV